MIPGIGLMIAAYTIARLCVVLGQPKTKTGIAAKIICGIAIAVIVLSTIDVLSAGMQINKLHLS